MEIHSAPAQLSAGGTPGHRRHKSTERRRGWTESPYSGRHGYQGLTTAEVPLMAGPSRCPRYPTVYPGSASVRIKKNFGAEQQVASVKAAAHAAPPLALQV